jgi:phosphoserine phosphatase
MTTILLIRHGHVDGIKPERFRGRQPLALTARGRAEAQAVAQRVAGAWRPRQIYTSPLGRCIETGTAIAKTTGAPTEICNDLTDIDYGAWQFKTFDDAERENAALFAAWFATPHLVRFPNGESLQDLAARAANALRFVLSRHPDDTVVLVSHDSINRALLMQLIDQPLSAYWTLAQSPCCLNEIDVTGGRVAVRRINETGYLDGNFDAVAP